MNDQEIVDLVNKSLSEEFELDMDDMVPEATLYDDLGLDSLDTVHGDRPRRGVQREAAGRESHTGDSHPR